MNKQFDEAAYRQALIDKGSNPDQATDIARKMAEAQGQQPQRARAPTVLPPSRAGAGASGKPAKSAPLASKKQPTKASATEGAAAAAPGTRSRRSRKKGHEPVPGEAFSTAQLTLFQSFLANDTDRDLLSNAVDLWDSIPRYSMARRKQEELRLPGGFLPIRKISFQYRGMQLTAVIRPARLERSDGQGAGQGGGTIEYYPSAREELIEQALRRMATERAAGFFDGEQPRAGLYFTLYRLRQELAAHGHSMTHRELAEGLDILSLSQLDIEFESERDALAVGRFGRNPFLVNLIGVKREDLERDPNARWYVEFHPFVVTALDKITYRQFNYQRWMRARGQLTRWLISQLVLKAVQAEYGRPFVMKYSTIKRDSGLLEGYKLQRQAVAALDEAWDELVEPLGLLESYTKDEERGARSKLEDVTYSLRPSRTFAREQRTANKRRLLAKEGATEPAAQSDTQQVLL